VEHAAQISWRRYSVSHEDALSNPCAVQSHATAHAWRRPTAGFEGATTATPPSHFAPTTVLEQVRGWAESPPTFLQALEGNGTPDLAQAATDIPAPQLEGRRGDGGQSGFAMMLARILGGGKGLRDIERKLC
jgi:hypothetical protein